MREHIHLSTCDRGGSTVQARRVFRAKRERNATVTIPPQTEGFLLEPLVELGLHPEHVASLHVGCRDKDCPLLPVPPVLSWGREDGLARLPEAFLLDNPSDQPIDVELSSLHD